MKQNQYEIIVLDLDGTLTNRDKVITPRTKKALMEAQARGKKVVLASGRPTQGVMPLAEELDLKAYGGFILSYNGGRIMSCTTGEVCNAAAWLLQYGGHFCLCQRPERLTDVLLAMRQAGLEPKRLRWVQQRPEKAPWLFLVEGKAGAKPGLTVEPPLIVESADGSYSDEMKMIYRIV